MKKDPFQKEYDLQNKGTNQEKYDNLPEFPHLLDIELVGGYCTMSCPICIVGRGDFKRKRGFMTEETYLKIIDEISEYKTPIRMIRWGEPLMHPSFWEFVQIAKDKDLKVHANTNGTRLREMKAPINSIKVSIHENYPRVLRGLESLFTMNCFRHVSITSDELIETGMDFDWKFDEMPVDKISQYATFRKDRHYNKRLPNCPEVFDKLSINWDGTVSACCNDADNQMIVGDIHKESLKEIWLGPRMQHYRKLILEEKNWGLPLCRDCWDLGVTD